MNGKKEYKKKEKRGMLQNKTKKRRKEN